MLETPPGMWLCSAGLSNPIQLLQFPLPEASHSETELCVERGTWEGRFHFSRNELNVKKKYFHSFPKYQSISKHEKQLVIHKASGTFVIYKGRLVWLKECWRWEQFTGLDQFEWMEITKVPEAGENEALKLADACHLHAESDRDVTDFPHKGNSFSHL